MSIYSGENKPKFAVAPMLDWTDRHCRYLFRLLTKCSLLYTEMVVADAAIHGVRERLLGFSEEEHPIALQLGGSDLVKLSEAAKIGEDFGYDEINLNVGCPSDRVQSGSFGACLMLKPDVVMRAISAMKQAVNIPVTVKCRIGVDEQDSDDILDTLSKNVWNAGCDALWVHARKAWLKGLSPKENRDIPPLDYDRVYRLKSENQTKFIGINGGIKSIDACKEHLDYVDGVMVGRYVYQNPMSLINVDGQIFNAKQQPIDEATIIDAMCEYADRHIANGGRLSHVTRHMVGLFHGRNGARKWRQILSGEANRPDATSALLREAFSYIC